MKCAKKKQNRKRRTSNDEELEEDCSTGNVSRNGGRNAHGLRRRRQTTEAAKDNAPKAEAGAEAGKDEGEASADSGEKKQVYVFIRDRGDLSYWDSMAAGGDRSVTDYADRADVHVVETTADLQANLQAMYEAADKGADLIITASDFRTTWLRLPAMVS